MRRYLIQISWIWQRNEQQHLLSAPPYITAHTLLSFLFVFVPLSASGGIYSGFSKTTPHLSHFP
jgi:hypothetical protein